MDLLRRARRLLGLDLRERIGAAADPLGEARRLVRELDDAVARLRARLAAVRGERTAAARDLQAARDRLTRAAEAAAAAVDADRDEDARQALRRQGEAAAEEERHRTAEARLGAEEETLEAELQRLEDRAQEARRRRERLGAARRRSGGDFSPLGETAGSILCERAPEAEAALRRWLRERERRLDEGRAELARLLARVHRLKKLQGAAGPAEAAELATELATVEDRVEALQRRTDEQARTLRRVQARHLSLGARAIAAEGAGRAEAQAAAAEDVEDAEQLLAALETSVRTLEADSGGTPAADAAPSTGARLFGELDGERAIEAQLAELKARRRRD